MPDVERRPARDGRPALTIHRSPRRRRSASAAVEDGEVVVRLPAALPDDEAERTISRLVDRVTGAARAARRGGDQTLQRRADELADRYLDGVRATSVRWSARMRRRHGSCTPATGEIRIAQRLASAPAYVLDHVLLHELVHLQVPDHSPRFHRLLANDPHAERAIGWLEGYAAGRLAATVDPLADDEPAPTVD